MRSLALLALLGLLLAGCAGSSTSTGSSSPAPSADGNVAEGGGLITEVAPTTDVLRLGKAPAFTFGPPSGTQVATDIPASATSLASSPVDWAYTAERGLRLTGMAWNLTLDVPDGAIVNPGGTGCAFEVSLVFQAPGRGSSYSTGCTTETGPYPAGLHRVADRWTGPMDEPLPAGGKVTLQLTSYLVVPGGAQVRLLSGTKQTDSTLTLVGLKHAVG
jgi:hypothetical protein